MSMPFSLCRADFLLSFHRTTCRQLITHVVNLLNRRFTAGVVIRFIKVKAHCGELLNDAAPAKRRQETAQWRMHCIWIQMLFNFTSETDL
jgi:hypothetical protein